MQKIDLKLIGELDTLIEKGDISSVLKKILEHLEDCQIKKDAVTQNGRLNKIERDWQLGLVRYEEYLPIYSQILDWVVNQFMPTFKNEKQDYVDESEIATTESENQGIKKETLVIEIVDYLKPPEFRLPRKIRKQKTNDASTDAEYQDFDWQTELENYPKIALLADAGMGKSHEMRWLSHQLKASGQYLPIFEALRDKKYLRDLPQIWKKK